MDGPSLLFTLITIYDQLLPITYYQTAKISMLNLSNFGMFRFSIVKMFKFNIFFIPKIKIKKNPRKNHILSLLTKSKDRTNTLNQNMTNIKISCLDLTS